MHSKIIQNVSFLQNPKQVTGWIVLRNINIQVGRLLVRSSLLWLPPHSQARSSRPSLHCPSYSRLTLMAVYLHETWYSPRSVASVADSCSAALIAPSRLVSLAHSRSVAFLAHSRLASLAQSHLGYLAP